MVLKIVMAVIIFMCALSNVVIYLDMSHSFYKNRYDFLLGEAFTQLIIALLVLMT